jgi:signal peptidase I
MASGEGGYTGYRLARDETAVLTSSHREITLGPGEYLLLGDNSPMSYDGRHYGPIRRERIIARAARVYWPLTRVRALDGE